MEKKICSKCKTEKDDIDFGKSNRTKSGLRSECKKCRIVFQQENKDKLKEYHKKNYINNRERKINYQKKYYLEHSKKIISYQKSYFNTNKEKKLKYLDDYKIKNHDKILNYKRKYEKQKREDDCLFKLKQTLRSRIRLFIKSRGLKKNGKTFDIVGCSPIFLKEYLENQFTIGMSWDNHGEWHIDHIVPLSSAKTEEELYKLCFYTNLQPLWSEDNLKKSNKIM
jgi:hypothetical protein